MTGPTIVQAEHLRLYYEREIENTKAETAIKRAARLLGVPGGQCRRDPGQFDPVSAVLTTRFMIRRVWVEFITSAAGGTTVVVPPVDGPEPWAVANALRFTLYRLTGETPEPVPYISGEGVKQQCENDESPRRPRRTLRGLFARAVRRLRLPWNSG